MTDTGEISGSATGTDTRGLKVSLANPKIIHRIGCWNVRKMYYSNGKTAQVVSEVYMQRYRISILNNYSTSARWI